MEINIQEDKKILMIFVFAISLLTFFSTPSSFGHGFDHNTTPTQNLGDREIALKFTTSPSYDPDSDAREISFQFVEGSDENIINGTVFEIKTTKSGEFLFEYVSEKQNDGILIMALVPAEEKTIYIDEETVTSKEYPDNPSYDLVSVNGNYFDTGGLYLFEVKILAAENTMLVEPLVFFVLIPFPHETFHEIADPTFGTQVIKLISYYDKPNNFQFEPQTRTFSFDMPFEWSDEIINKTSYVHEELTIPKTFGSLMVSSYKAYVNDVQIPSRLITLDEFWEDGRLVHIILSHGDLLELQTRQDSKISGMKFVLKPTANDIPFSAVTDNGKFRIIMEPKNFEVGSIAKILFNFFEISSIYTPVETNYDILISSGGETILTNSKKSTNSLDNPNEIKFVIPENSNGFINLKFSEVGGNPLSTTTLSIKIPTKSETNNLVESTTKPIQNNFKNNSPWWSQEKLDKYSVRNGILFLIRDGFIPIPQIEPKFDVNRLDVPLWVKNNVAWWADNKIDDNTFIQGIQFMIKEGIIRG